MGSTEIGKYDKSPVAATFDPRYLSAQALIEGVQMSDALVDAEAERRSSEVYRYPAEHAASPKGVLTDEPEIAPLESPA